MKYAVIIERTTTGFSAYVPDLPGCVATAANLDDCRRELAAVVQFHLEGLREDGQKIPEPCSLAAHVAA